MAKIKTGTFTSASGTSETIELGFKPDRVDIFNQSATQGEVIKAEWFGSAMGDGKEFRYLLGASSVIAMAFVSSGGNFITKTGSSTTVTNGVLTTTGKEGFTIDSAFLDASDVVWWEARQND